MPVTSTELSTLKKVKAYIPPCKVYTAGVVDADRAVSQDDIAADMRVLLEVSSLKKKYIYIYINFI